MVRRQNNGSVKAVSPRHCAATNAPRNCCFNCRAGQSHKDNVRCTAVEEQPEAKEVQLSQPSSTSLLMISPGTPFLYACQARGDRKRLRSLLSCLCDVFRALITSLAC